MKKLCLLITLCLLAIIFAYPQSTDKESVNEILLTGKYSGQNLVVTNPSVGDGFCITQVVVNGQEIPFTQNSNSFEIPLNNFLKDEMVSVQITHQEGCEPHFVNAEVLITEKEFKVPSFQINKRNKTLSWDKSELDSGKTYVLEQFIYGKWQKIKDLGTPETMFALSYPPILNSGNNFFRMKETDAHGKVLVSKSLKIKISDKHVEVKSLKTSKLLEFSEVTHYEIIDAAGFFVKSGTAKNVDVSDLSKGNYFLNYDGKQVVFTKK